MKKKILIGITSAFLLFLGISICYYFNEIEKKNQDEISKIEKEEAEEEETIIVEIPRKEDSFVNLVAIGDIMCHNSQYKDAFLPSQNTYDFSYVFEDVKEYVSSADIAIGNLETTFAGAKRGYSNYPQFNTPEQLADGLKECGIDVLSTANNHCMDTRYSGLESTLNYLDTAGILHTGTNRSQEEQNTILIQEVNDIKIAFLAFTYGTNGISIPADKSYAVNLIDENFMREQLNKAKAQKPDLICVSMHWGVEYQTHQNEEQENLANFLFENGANIIFGSHPHVLQPMEKRTIKLANGREKDVFVMFSFGNFMSGQTQKNTRSSIILNLAIKKSGRNGEITIEDVSYIPIYMYKSTQTSRKYRILDMEKTIAQYESGKDREIGQNQYDILKKEWEQVKLNIGN